MIPLHRLCEECTVGVQWIMSYVGNVYRSLCSPRLSSMLTMQAEPRESGVCLLMLGLPVDPKISRTGQSSSTQNFNDAISPSQTRWACCGSTPSEQVGLWPHRRLNCSRKHGRRHVSSARSLATVGPPISNEIYQWDEEALQGQWPHKLQMLLRPQPSPWSSTTCILEYNIQRLGRWSSEAFKGYFHIGQAYKFHLNRTILNRPFGACDDVIETSLNVPTRQDS